MFAEISESNVLLSQRGMLLLKIAKAQGDKKVEEYQVLILEKVPEVDVSLRL